MNCLAPSILSADFCDMGTSVREVDLAGAHYIHIDVMDGMFVPKITFGDNMVKAIRDVTDKILDVHLMIENPDKHVQEFIEAGADIISVHVEACTHLDRTLNAIKDGGIMACAALNPATPLETIKHVLPLLDMVLIMTVNPGFGGQKFIGYSIDKIKALSAMIKERGLSTDIEVDGGITVQNAAEVIEAGANVLVAGTAVFKGDIRSNVAAFLEKL